MPMARTTETTGEDVSELLNRVYGQLTMTGHDREEIITAKVTIRSPITPSLNCEKT